MKEKLNIFFLIGFPGVGKSFWGKKIAHKLGWDWRDLDAEIVHKYQSSIEQIFERQGESAFRKLESDLLLFFIHNTQKTTLMLTTGGGTPCFYDNITYMKNNGIVIWIDLSIDILVGRLAQNQDRPLVKGLTKEGLRQYVTKTMQERLPFYKQAHYTIHNPQKLEDFNTVFSLL